MFRGLEKISVDGVQKDYMKISYRDGGSLFVPVNQMDMVQKYIGTGSAMPKLNKLGGQDWAKAKAKARKAVQIMAEDLVALYAKRAAAKGHEYGKDTKRKGSFSKNKAGTGKRSGDNRPLVADNSGITDYPYIDKNGDFKRFFISERLSDSISERKPSLPALIPIIGLSYFIACFAARRIVPSPPRTMTASTEEYASSVER